MEILSNKTTSISPYYPQANKLGDKLDVKLISKMCTSRISMTEMRYLLPGFWQIPNINKEFTL